MPSKSVNPFIAEAERRKTADTAGGKGSSWARDSWGGGGKGNFTGDAPINWVRLYKNDIIDMRCYKFDKKGKVIPLVADEYAHTVSFSAHVPATDRELISDGLAVPVLVSGNSKKNVNRVIAEILTPMLTLDLTVNQAKTVAAVLNFTYSALGVRHKSIQTHANESYGSVAQKIKNRIEGRLLQERLAKEKLLQSSDEESDEDEYEDDGVDHSKRSVSAQNASFVQGLSAATASSTGAASSAGLPQELAAGIQELIKNFDKKTSVSHFNLSTPNGNPADKKKKRITVVRKRDLGAEMEGVVTEDAPAAVQTGQAT